MTADFSQDVLARASNRLGVFSVGDVGWSDLGDPQRLAATMRETGTNYPWLAQWNGEAETANSHRDSGQGLS